MGQETVTIVDVLDNALDGDLRAGAVTKLSTAQLAELAGNIERFYDAWTPPSLADHEFRVHLGGWVAANLAAPEQQAFLCTALLYAHSAVMHDPVGDWFEPRRSRINAPAPIGPIAMSEAHLIRADGGYFTHLNDPEVTRQRLAHGVTTLATLSPLIREGVVVPVPHIRWLVAEQEAAISTARHDIKDPLFIDAIANPIDLPAPHTDQIRGGEVTVNGLELSEREKARSLAENPSYHLSKNLGIAARAHARYVPPAATDWKLLEARYARAAVELRQRARLELRVIPALAIAELPFARDLDPATLITIRRDEESFADWRATLRDALQAVEAEPSSPEDFEESAGGALQDRLVPMANSLRSRTPSRFGRAAATGTIELVAGATGVMAATAAGYPTAAQILSEGVSAAVRTLLAATRPDQELTGAPAVIAHLQRRG